MMAIRPGRRRSLSAPTSPALPPRVTIRPLHADDSDALEAAIFRLFRGGMHHQQWELMRGIVRRSLAGGVVAAAFAVGVAYCVARWWSGALDDPLRTGVAVAAAAVALFACTWLAAHTEISAYVGSCRDMRDVREVAENYSFNPRPRVGGD